MLHRLFVATFVACLSVASTTNTQAQDSKRPEAQKRYAESLWKYLSETDYRKWERITPSSDFPSGPPSDDSSQHFRLASKNSDAAQGVGVLVVTEHYQGDSDTPTAITARRKMAEGFDADNDDWHWVHYAASGKPMAISAENNPWAKDGFAVYEEDGRLWVFEISSPELTDFVEKGELAKHVIRPGVGPAGMTLKAPDAETISRYLTAKPGFETKIEDGRLWVFAAGTEELNDYEQQGELAKHVIRPGAGPMGMTMKAPDTETLDLYLASKLGFVLKFDDGRLWVFRKGSEELSDFLEQGELAKHVIRPAAGPNGVTLKAPDAETIDAYLVAQPGFVTKLDDGRVWVFRNGSEELKSYREAGELAKHVIRPAAGPGGLTLKAPDAETIDAYLRVCGLN
ncbi:MAG: hypothetical protein ACF787_00335 [Rhodopirellula sp. JB053]